jgi:hypothetical protein
MFRGIEARLLVKSGRPLVAPAHELSNWILQRMTMFAEPDDAGRGRTASGRQRRRGAAR